MGIINTGMERATELVVDKRVGGNSIAGYPKLYKVYDSFSNYPAISKDEIAQIYKESYLARLAAFKTFVESVETGVNVDLSDTYRENLTACPI